MINPIPPRVKPGSPLKAEMPNALIAREEEREATHHGMHHLDHKPFWCLLDASGQTPYTDERYWLRRMKCTITGGDHTDRLRNADGTTKYLVVTTSEQENIATQITATNIAEFIEGTHELLADWPVLVHYISDTSGGHYVFNAGSIDGVLHAKIVTPASLAGNKLYSTAYPCDSDGGNVDEDTTLYIFHKWQNGIADSDMTVIPHLTADDVVPYLPFDYDIVGDATEEECGILLGEWCLPEGAIVAGDEKKPLQLNATGQIVADWLYARTP